LIQVINHFMRLKKNSFVIFVTLIAFSFVLISFEYQTKDIYDAEDITDKMFIAISNIKTMRYKLKIAERINGKIENRESSVKLQVSPRKLYL